MADRKLKTVTRTQGNNQALKDGTVRPDSFTFAFEDVPVLVDGGKVVTDSMAIVRYLDEKFPGTSSLYPKDSAREAECLIFIDWFNRVWKRPPNEIEGELTKPEGERDMERVERLGKAMAGYFDLGEFGIRRDVEREVARQPHLDIAAESR